MEISQESKGVDATLLNKTLRINFTRKVFGILTLQLIVTCIISALSMCVPAFLEFQMKNAFLLFPAIVITLIVPVLMTCFRNLARKVPGNYILLAIFTLSDAYIVSIVCGNSDPKHVLISAIFTLSITIALTVFAFTSENDITIADGSLLTVIISSLLLGFCSLLFNNGFLHTLTIALIGIVYGIYIVFDVEMIVGGKRGELDVDDYIKGSVLLYIDIIQLFLKILEFLGEIEKVLK